jgi:hypothetical protein
VEAGNTPSMPADYQACDLLRRKVQENCWASVFVRDDRPAIVVRKRDDTGVWDDFEEPGSDVVAFAAPE